MKKRVLSDNIRKELEERKAKIIESHIAYNQSLSFEERINKIKETTQVASEKHINNEDIKIVEEVQDTVRIELGNIVKQMLKEDENKKAQELANNEEEKASEEIQVENVEEESKITEEPEATKKPEVDMNAFLKMNDKMLKNVIAKSEAGILRLKNDLSKETDDDKKVEIEVHILKYEAILDAAKHVAKDRDDKHKTQGEER